MRGQIGWRELAALGSFFLFSEVSWMMEFHKDIKYLLKTRFCLVDVTLVYFVLYGLIWVCWFLFPYELINRDWKLSSSSFFYFLPQIGVFFYLMAEVI